MGIRACLRLNYLKVLNTYKFRMLNLGSLVKLVKAQFLKN